MGLLLFDVMAAIQRLPRGHMPTLHRLLLATIANYGEHAYPSLATLAEATGSSPSSVKRALRDLEVAEWLTRERRRAPDGSHQSTVYVIHLGGSPVTPAEDRPTGGHGPTRANPSSGSEVSPGGANPWPTVGPPLAHAGPEVSPGGANPWPTVGHKPPSEPPRGEPPRETPTEPPTTRAGAREAAGGVDVGRASQPPTLAPSAAEPILTNPEPAQRKRKGAAPKPRAERGKATGKRERGIEDSLRRYAEAYAAGQCDAGAQGFVPPTDSRARYVFRTVLKVKALDARGEPLQGQALDAWIRESSKEFRLARPSAATFGGFEPPAWATWLNAERPRDDQQRSRSPPKQPSNGKTTLATVKYTKEELDDAERFWTGREQA